MTEDTNGARLYVWITRWDDFQLRKDGGGYPWFKVYSDLTSKDEWNELSTANRCLLIGLWSDTNRLGLGRVSANLSALRSRHSCRRASLEPLVQAGFITISSTQGAQRQHTNRALDVEKKKKKKEEKERSPNGAVAPGDLLPNGRRRITDEEAAELARINREEMGGPA